MKNFEKSIPDIEGKIAYTFRDKSLLRQAFTRTSYCNEASRSAGLQSNEVLEFFGDSVLSACIITFLIKQRSQRYAYGIRTELKEGDFSNIRSKLSDKTNLSENIKRLGLQKYFLMGEGDAKLGIENEPSVTEDLFESIIGAIYIDSEMNMECVMRSVEHMLDLSVYLAPKAEAPIQSFKNQLQEYCQDKKRRLPAPVYKTVADEGPDHDKLYTVACYVGGRLLGEGKGRSVKLAQTAAAEEALKALLNS